MFSLNTPVRLDWYQFGCLKVGYDYLQINPPRLTDWYYCVAQLNVKHFLQYIQSSQITDLPFSAYQNGLLAGSQDDAAYTVIYGKYRNVGEMPYIHILPKYGG